MGDQGENTKDDTDTLGRVGSEESSVTKNEKEDDFNENCKETEAQDQNSKNGSSEPEIEMSPEEMKQKIKKYDDIFDKMKACVFRTDISAMEKVNQVKLMLVPPAPVEEKAKHQENTGNLKRPADNGDEAPKPKVVKTGEDDGKGDEIGSDDEDRDIDSCVVCGLYLQVFKEDKAKELHHYLSHGFNILKEFDILKPDDSLFLCCALCSSVYPRKCHVNFRKHLVSDHTERIVEIFREI